MSNTGLLKTCSSCLRSWPEDYFRPCRRGGTARRSQCRACHTEDQRARRLRRRQRRDRRAVGQASTAIMRASNTAKVGEIAGKLVAGVGGLDRLAETWKAHVQAAEPGSRRALVALSALARLMECSTSSSKSEFNYLSDEELDREIAREMEATLARLGVLPRP